jgi:tRNA pseudouridine55 synthase
VAAYEAARKGDALELEPRTIEVAAARLLGVECVTEYSWDIEFEVSKGTYIRALARDLGRALDTAAHLGALRRTRSGAMDVTHACTLEQLEAESDVSSLFADPFAALGLPIVSVDDTQAARLATGAALADDAEGMVAVAHDGVLLGVYAGSKGTLKPLSVIPGGVTGGAR